MRMAFRAAQVIPSLWASQQGGVRTATLAECSFRDTAKDVYLPKLCGILERFQILFVVAVSAAGDGRNWFLTQPWLREPALTVRSETLHSKRLLPDGSVSVRDSLRSHTNGALPPCSEIRP